MKIFKNNVKMIFGFIIVAIIASGISVYATTTFLASQVTYKDGKSVAEALDELYAEKQEGNQTNLNNRTYLYNNGDECEDITGGWEEFAWDPWNYGSVAAYSHKGVHTLDFGDYSKNYFGDGGFKTKNNINLNDYSKLYIDVSSFTCNFVPRTDGDYPNACNGYYIYIGNKVLVSRTYKSDTTTSETIEVDISDNNTNDILKMYSMCSNWGLNGCYIASCNINAIWLEK